MSVSPQEAGPECEWTLEGDKRRERLTVLTVVTFQP